MSRVTAACVRRRVTSGLGLGFGLLLLVSAGCAEQTVTLSPQERLGLERRAMSLLLRAAQSEDGVVRANAIESLVQVAPEEGLPSFRVALRADAPLVRYAACVALGELRDSSSRDTFRRLLSDESERVQLAAAFALCRCGEDEPAALLVQALSENADENVRADAAYLIGRLGDPRAIKRLEYAALHDSSKKVAVHAYAALALLGERRGVDALIQYAQGDPVARLLALQSLAEVRQERARDALRYRMGPAEDYLEAKLIAARGLGYLGSDEGFDLAVYTLRQSGGDENDRMRLHTLAALALGAIGDPRGLPLLRELAESEHDARVQVAACFAICQIARGK